MEIVYKIDGHDFKDYGVYVSASHGLIGGLKPKKRVEVKRTILRCISRRGIFR